jgi:hypothetical protein
VPELPALCVGVIKKAQGPVGHLPAKKTFLRWIFAYVVQL